jgi:ATP-dependent DNA helicase RecQ
MAKKLSKTAVAVLKEYFGYPKFRPLQEEIITSSLNGRDVIALLPTGGGKSICYQIPAIMRSGLTVVISPLIALMKDQVDSLNHNGIPAAYLNSSLNETESRETWRRIYSGEIKILYVSPERLLLDGMLQTLRDINLEFVAIDEAHCISSWGHDFRPEYRALRRIRELFPEIPLMALTASATERVREDIAEMLGMIDPEFYVASFNRPNLSYRIIPKMQPLKQVREILSEHTDESGIIYCLSRNSTERIAEELVRNGVKASAYHAGLSSEHRSKRQEQFVNDEIQVMVATIAFGMGIDKPDVRFVIHHDLPKNIESYYQETGRAGRDGLPSECVLLYTPADAAKLRTFNDKLSDDTERDHANRQLTSLLNFAESSECRRITLLRHFGETYRDANNSTINNCGSCDNCLTPRTSIDGTEIAQKYISCVLRVQKHSGFSVGFGHLTDILTGASTEKIRRWGHDSLSTYGIGANRSKSEWTYFGRELVTRGLLKINQNKYNVIEVTQAGVDFLKNGSTVSLTAPLVTSKLSSEKKALQKKRLGAIEYDRETFEKLRVWRMETARTKSVPAYLIFSDVTLQQLAAKRPKSIHGLSAISGIGEKKLSLYGEQLLEVLSQ